VALSPWTDLALTGESMDSEDEGDPMVRRAGLARMADWYLSGRDAREPYASPLYGDLAGIAPLAVHVGEVEVLRDDATRIAERAGEAGVDVSLHVHPEMIHVFQVFAGLFPEADEGVTALAGWIREQVA
jgi:acetyl esterase/lipase